MTSRNTHTDPVHESIEILLDELGITLDELESRKGKFASSDERRAWLLVDARRQQAALSE